MSIGRKPLTLPTNGFAHYIVPVVMVAIIAIVGGYVLLNRSSAATSTAAVYLESGVTGKCFDDHHDSAVNGIRDDSYNCNQTEAQEWIINSNGTIENPNGKCIDNRYGKNLNNNPITVYTCSSTNTAEQWTTAGNILKNPATNKCIDDPYASTTNGTELILYTCNGKKQQKWTITKPSTSTGSGSGSSTSGAGNGGGSSGVGSSAPPTSGTNATVDFRTTLSGTQTLNTYSVGDTISTYGGNQANISNTTWRDTLAALGPLAWRVPERDTDGTATGAGGGGGGTGYVQYIDDMKGVPVVIASGATGDDDLNDTDISNLVHYYNDNGGQNGGPVKAWIVGNEPEGDGGFGQYLTELPGAVNAIENADPTIPVTISAGTVWDQNDISLLPQVATSSVGSKVTYLSWHAYQGKDSNGINSGQYAGPLYYAETKQAEVDGKESALEEFNWDSSCPGNGAMNTWQNELFIASVIGNVLAAGGAHAYMYSDSNGCGTLSNGDDGGVAEGEQLPAYWALGMWTGMNGEFDRFGSQMVDTKVDGYDISDTSARETAGLAHEVELFATNNGKILAINENPSTTEAMTIGIGGYTSGTYNVWQTNQNNDIGTAGAPKEVVTNGSFTGSKISISLPAGTISSIDVK